jgi:DNA-binding MarR family transcriptional regulator
MVVTNSRASGEGVFATLGIGYLGQFLGQRINEMVLDDCKRKGFVEMRVSHGYVIQHLVEESAPVARTGTELARRMGVTQQAASKAVSELARLGVVEVSRAADRRAKEIRLTAQGWKGVQCARSSRSRIEAKLANRVGKQGYDKAREVLQACMKVVGGIERIRSRRVRQPT